MNKEKEREEFMRLSNELLEKLSILLHGVNPGLTVNALGSMLCCELLTLKKTHPDDVILLKGAVMKMFEKL